MNWLVGHGTLILAFITIITLFASIIGFNVLFDTIHTGELTTPSPPSSYVIIRGLEAFPSDHIIIPVDFYNSWRAKSEIIRQPYLILRNSSNTYRFYFMGEIPKYSRGNFNQNYNNELDRSGTFVIPPNSLSTHALVFQIERYWDNTSRNYNFKFLTSDYFQCDIGYEQWNGKKFENKYRTSYFYTPIRGYVGQLSRESGNYWDWYAFNSSTGELL